MRRVFWGVFLVGTGRPSVSGGISDFWEAMDQAAEPKQAAAVAAAAARDKSVIDDLMFHVRASRDERNCRAINF